MASKTNNKPEGLAPQISNSIDQDKFLYNGLAAVPKNFPELSDDLKTDISKLLKKGSPETIKKIIKRLCSLGPLTPKQLSRILDRSPGYIKTEFLYKMIKTKELTYLYPDRPSHSRQAYKLFE